MSLEELKQMKPRTDSWSKVKRMLQRFQQSTDLDKLFISQSVHISLLKKLYAKYDLELRGGGACPEQYDVYKNDQLVGYFRLRHSVFTVEYVDDKDEYELLYETHPMGDGMFQDDERFNYMSIALHKLLKRLNNE
jgi:hypothetical protein